MKLVCDCGYKESFCEINEDTKEKNDYTEGEGLFTTIEDFTIWKMDYTVGIVCNKCGKDIWVFA